jgi:Holliday junction resolvasome RuvABC endonuclease subunit
MVKISLLNNPVKNICAIDASTNNLAFAIFSDKNLEACGKISFKGVDNYSKVGDAARKSFAFLKNFEIDAIVIEHTVFMNSPKTAADLALVQGGLLGAARMAGIKRFGSVSPITWQNYIGNKKLTNPEKLEIAQANPGKAASTLKSIEREARKQKTIKFVNTFYDKNISDNDVADAIAIGHYAISNLGKVGL